MSIEYEVYKTVDHNAPNAKKLHDGYVNEWKQQCMKKVASRNALRKGGRTLRRELKRKRVRFKQSEDEEQDRLVYRCTESGRTISLLYISFENFDPEPEATPQ